MAELLNNERLSVDQDLPTGSGKDRIALDRPCLDMFNTLTFLNQADISNFFLLARYDLLSNEYPLAHGLGIHEFRQSVFAANIRPSYAVIATCNHISIARHEDDGLVHVAQWRGTCHQVEPTVISRKALKLRGTIYIFPKRKTRDFVFERNRAIFGAPTSWLRMRYHSHSLVILSTLN